MSEKTRRTFRQNIKLFIFTSFGQTYSYIFYFLTFLFYFLASSNNEKKICCNYFQCILTCFIQQIKLQSSRDLTQTQPNEIEFFLEFSSDHDHLLHRVGCYRLDLVERNFNCSARLKIIFKFEPFTFWCNVYFLLLLFVLSLNPNRLVLHTPFMDSE